MPGIDISSHSSSGIILIECTEQDFACSRIPQVRTVRIFFVYHIIFQARTVGIQVSKMLRIAMSQSGRIQQGSVMVDGSRTVCDFVTSVSVHIAHSQTVSTLGISRILTSMSLLQYLSIGIGHLPVVGSQRSMEPFGLEFLSIEIYRPEIRAGIIATAHHGTRLLVGTLQESHASQVSLATVAIVCLVAPYRRIGRESVLQMLPLFHLIACTEGSVGLVPDGMHRLSGFAMEDRQQFRTGHNATSGIAIVGMVVDGADSVIRSRIAHKPAPGIYRTRRCLADHFCLAIAVEIIDQELGIVGTGTDILTQIDAPELGSVELVAVEDDLSRIAVMRIVMGIGRVPFQDDFVFSVSIHIAHATVVGGIFIGFSIGSDTAGRTVDGQGAIEIIPWLNRLRNFSFSRSIHPGFLLISDDSIAAGSRTFPVCIIGQLHLMGDNLSISFYVEAYVLAVRTQQSPAEEDSLVLGRQSHQATVQLLHLRYRSLHLCMEMRAGSHTQLHTHHRK